MADYYVKTLAEWFDHWNAWQKWFSQKPSPWRLIKYIKWLRSEPRWHW